MKSLIYQIQLQFHKSFASIVPDSGVHKTRVPPSASTLLISNDNTMAEIS